MAGRSSRFLDECWRIALIGGHGLMRVWWAIRRPVLDGAFVAVWSGDRLLLVRSSYKSHDSLPSGYVGRRESPRIAAARELREEVGLVAKPEELDAVCELEVPWEGKTDRAHFFELVLPKQPPLEVDRREVVGAGFYSLEEMRGRKLSPHLERYLEVRFDR